MYQMYLILRNITFIFVARKGNDILDYPVGIEL